MKKTTEENLVIGIALFILAAIIFTPVVIFDSGHVMNINQAIILISIIPVLLFFAYLVFNLGDVFERHVTFVLEMDRDIGLERLTVVK
jgi:uncharacterized membrane protein YhhN